MFKVNHGAVEAVDILEEAIDFRFHVHVGETLRLVVLRQSRPRPQRVGLIPLVIAVRDEGNSRPARGRRPVRPLGSSAASRSPRRSR